MKQLQLLLLLGSVSDLLYLVGFQERQKQGDISGVSKEKHTKREKDWDFLSYPFEVNH